MRALRLALVALALSLSPVRAKDFNCEVIDPSYQHDKYGTEPKNAVRVLRAYVTIFESDDDDGGGRLGTSGIPEWVAYEMREYPRTLRRGPGRPSTWITDPEFFEAGIAISDKTYAYSLAFRKKDRNWCARVHLCMRQHAGRPGAAANWNTRTVLNAIPQREYFSSGIWQDLKNKTAEWVEPFGAVWIIVGPIFNNRRSMKTPGTFGGSKWTPRLGKELA